MKTIYGLLMLSIMVYTGPCYSQDYHYANDFAQPLICSPDGIREFLTRIYNQPSYGKEFLPNNFSHMIQFLDHGKQATQKKSYARSVLRLFNNKLKSSNYTNAYAFGTLLEKLPELMEDYFIVYKSPGILETLKESIYDILCCSFKDKFLSFKENPTQFLDAISQEIVDAINKKNIIEISHEELRKVLLTFLEMNLNKLVWSPEDGIQTWESVKQIAHDLTRLVEYNIIDDPDDLNDLFITLIERYCFFLDVTSANFPVDFYQKIKNDITSQSLFLFDLEEQEQYITPKRDIMMQGIFEAEAATRAREQGIVIQ